MHYIERELGQYPLSIGTSLALEGLYKKHPQQPKLPPDHKQISQLWINVRTVIRNFYASMTREEANSAPLSQSVELVMNELKAISTIVQQEPSRQLQVVFYISDLDELRWEFRRSRFTEYNTERKSFYHHLEVYTLKQLLQIAEDESIKIETVRRTPSMSSEVVALLTHYPHELFWRFKFAALFLLESHTGKLKPYSQWYTKLKNIKAEDHIPFNRLTYQIFGDGVVLEPMAQSLRQEVKDIAEARKWTAITTIAKIKDDIKQYGSDTLRKTVSMLKTE